MYRNGHYGAALLCYAPVGFGLLVAELESGAVVVGAIALALARTPDLDVRVPLISHRGITHTVWFALAVGALCAGAGWVLATPLGLESAATVAGLAGGAGALSIGSHLLADALTPMGIRPLWPLSGASYSLELVRADNWLANQLLLGAGVFAVAVAAVATNPSLVVG